MLGGALSSTLFILLLSLFSPNADARKPQYCTALDQRCWPSARLWAEFNASVGGQLLAVRPPAAPCHDPHYDQQACAVATARWSNPFWRSDQPGAMMENNWEMDDRADQGCFIHANRSSPCFQGSVPTYAVNVTQAAHVQLSVRFAAKHNLRLVVRNTGHDYLGRSTAKGAFSIWLHHLKDIEFHDEFLPEGCKGYRSSPESFPAVTIGAGVQWEELYLASARVNRVMVGGQCSSVGASGGYPQGGGHSPISPTFGLAADNVLQYIVITADGYLRTVNDCQNADLFWAMRGGGGGTYGIVVSTTYKTHPPFHAVFAGYNFTSSDTGSLENLLNKFVQMNPALSDEGWSGYFNLTQSSLAIRYLLPNGSASTSNSTFAELESFASQPNSGLQFQGGVTAFPSFEQLRLTVFCSGLTSCELLNGTYGNPTALASRLIPKALVETPGFQKDISKVLVNISQSFPGILGFLVAGGKVSSQVNNAVNPAWRKALWHVALSATWEDGLPAAEREAIKSSLSAHNKVLIDMTPGSGAYMNECDYDEPNYKASLYGANYKRLLRIKHRVDPRGLFTCHHCVGTDGAITIDSHVTAVYV